MEKLVRCIAWELFSVRRSGGFLSLGVQRKVNVKSFVDRPRLEVDSIAGLERIRVCLHKSQPLFIKLTEESA